MINIKYQTIHGFTLVELLISISILGLLASLTLVAINPAQRLIEGRDTKRIADLKQIAIVLESYNTKYSVYPAMTEAYLGWERSECTAVTCNTENPAPFLQELVSGEWLKNVPLPPLHPKKDALWGYLYQTDANRTAFCLLAHLENSNNPLVTQDAACDDTFNETWWYAISSELR